MERDIERVLISEEQIQEKVRELAAMLTREYADKDPVFVGVLKGVVMFFGGQFQNQGLTLLPTEYRNNTEPQKQYNRFLLRYMGNFHALVMPCGNIADDELDPDDRPIL